MYQDELDITGASEEGDLEQGEGAMGLCPVRACTPIPVISPSLQYHPLPLQPTLQNKERKKKNHLTMGAVVCHTVYPLARTSHTSLLANIHRNESFIGVVDASGFCCIINTVSSRGLLLGILLLSCVTEMLQLWICRTSPSTSSSSSQTHSVLSGRLGGASMQRRPFAEGPCSGLWARPL